MSQTMTVKVFDRAAETAAWGTGQAGPVVRTVTIAATCPVCGGPRGPVRWRRQCEDGEWFDINVWSNSCGHIDAYDAVLAEAAATPLSAQVAR